MMAPSGSLAAALAALAFAASAQHSQPAQDEEYKSSIVTAGDIAPPRVVPPCPPGKCRFAGQTVTVLMAKEDQAGALREIKAEFEAATGAKLNLDEVPLQALFASFMSDLTNRLGKYDAAYAGAWWLGELVAGDYLVSYDRYYNDPRFPKWDINRVLPAPRRLLSYAGRKYMVANDHDGQVMYYRRDLLEDPQHRAAFAAR
jgi:multiple sugar transport system substrate-binding protein